MKRTILAAIFLLTVTLAGAAYESSPARVTDISDRAYEGAVIKLLDGAKKSIVISMYSMSLGAQGNNPMCGTGGRSKKYHPTTNGLAPKGPSPKSTKSIKIDKID